MAEQDELGSTESNHRPTRDPAPSGLPAEYGNLGNWEDTTALDDIGWYIVAAKGAPPTTARTSSNNMVVAEFRDRMEALADHIHGLKYSPVASDRLEKPYHVQLPADRLGRFKRRRCDNHTLRRAQAQKFERGCPDYFKFAYQRRTETLDDEIVQWTVQLAASELCRLPCLFPLAGAAQARKRFGFDPFVMRVWQFEQDQRAFMKIADYWWPDEKRSMGGCLVYPPPPEGDRRVTKLENLQFRGTAAHEIGHAWWVGEGRWLPALNLIKPCTPAHEQAVSLFATFLMMYRGRVERYSLSPDELHTAFDDLGFETKYMADRKVELVASVARLASEFVNFIEPPEYLKIGEAQQNLPRCVLSEGEILALRSAARDVAVAAEPLALASVAAVIAARKFDCVINLNPVDPDRQDEIRWQAADRAPRSRNVRGEWVDYQWREYSINVPVQPGEPITPSRYRSLARHLAHIRLHGARAGTGNGPLRSDDLRCNESERDLARLVALVLFAHRGDHRRKLFSPTVAEALLTYDSSGLRELAPEVDRYFPWCTQDERVPEVRERYIGQIRELDESGRVLVNFWDEDGKVYETTFLKRLFDASHFARIEAGHHLDLFVITRPDGSEVLRPYPLKGARPEQILPSG